MRAMALKSSPSHQSTSGRGGLKRDVCCIQPESHTTTWGTKSFKLESTLCLARCSSPIRGLCLLQHAAQEIFDLLQALLQCYTDEEHFLRYKNKKATYRKSNCNCSVCCQAWWWQIYPHGGHFSLTSVPRSWCQSGHNEYEEWDFRQK